METLPRSATRHYSLSALIAKRAVTEAQKARKAGTRLLATIAMHQMASARESQDAIAAILAEQRIDSPPDGRLALAGYATDAASMAAMVESAQTDFAFARLVASLVQDAGNAAEQVAVSARPHVGWVRHLTPPSCSRCVPLAGRVYRYSDGFLRHPHDDCVTVPVRDGDDSFVVDPAEMVRNGQVSGLSKADRQAVLDGADFSQVVNVHRKASGLTMAGQSLTRAGRPTPAGIYRVASDREQALELLKRHGYLL